MYDYIYFLEKQHRYKSAIEIGEWLIHLFEINNVHQKNQGALQNILGMCYQGIGDHNKAIKYFNEAIKIGQKLMYDEPYNRYYKSVSARTYMNLANSLGHTNQLKRAKQYYLRALDIFREILKTNSESDEQAYVGAVYVNLANLLSYTGKIQSSEQYYQKALKIYKRLNNKKSEPIESAIACVCSNLGNLFFQQEQFEKAKASYLESLLIYYKLAKKNPELYEVFEAMNRYALGLTEVCLDNLGIARQHLEEALEFYKRFGLLFAKEVNHIQNILQSMNDIEI